MVFGYFGLFGVIGIFISFFSERIERVFFGYSFFKYEKEVIILWG